VLAAAYPAGTLAGALPGGWLAARAGVRTTVLLGLALMIASTVGFAFANSITVLDGARFVQGLGGVSPLVGRLSDRRGRVFPCLIGLGAAALLMPLFPLPDRGWLLAALVLVSAPFIGTLWAPSMAMLSDAAEALGIAQGFAFALSNLGWSIGQTVGAAASARLADRTADSVPFVMLSVIALVTFLGLERARRRAALRVAA